MQDQHWFQPEAVVNAHIVDTNAVVRCYKKDQTDIVVKKAGTDTE